MGSANFKSGCEDMTERKTHAYEYTVLVKKHTVVHCDTL